MEGAFGVTGTFYGNRARECPMSDLHKHRKAA